LKRKRSDTVLTSKDCLAKERLKFEDMGTEYEEFYAAREHKSNWIKCAGCSKRLHELCTVYCDQCNSCTKQSSRKIQDK
jgi:hypothetical protein